MKPSFIFIAVLAILGLYQLNAQGSFAVDGGMRWQRFAYNEGVSSKAFFGPYMGVSKSLGTQFELHSGASLFMWETERNFAGTEYFWISPGDFGHGWLMSLQVNVQFRWRPMGFEKGFFTGLGTGFFHGTHNLVYDRMSQPQLNRDLWQRPVFQAVAAYDIPVGNKHSIQFNSSMDARVSFSSGGTNHIMGSFGVGWRWAR
jgi:hypothetical protein